MFPVFPEWLKINVCFSTLWALLHSTSFSPRKFSPYHSSLQLPTSQQKKRRMSRYSRMEKVSTTRSKSLDFSDPYLPLKTPKPIQDYTSKPQDSKMNQNENIPEKNFASVDQRDEGEDDAGEVFGVILSRKCSVSSASSQNLFMCEKETSSLQSAVKRVFSMKRTSSVSEGYSRIHHQYDLTGNDEDDEVVALTSAVKTKSIKKRGKIYSVCRRIFGF